VGQGFIDRLILRARQETGCGYIEKGKAVRLSVDAMRKGECVAMLVDQRVTSGVEVDFFGRPTLVTDLPARLAIRFSTAVIPGDAQRLPGGDFLVTLYPPLFPDGGLPADQQARDLTQRMSKAIEAIIRRDPAAWFCTKRRWRTPRVRDAAASQGPPGQTPVQGSPPTPQTDAAP
jgi:KDO2-lipid IV(A) lauroyltransferase